MVDVCDESLCLSSFISPHCNLNLFLSVCLLSASKLPLLVSLSVCLSDCVSVSSLTASLYRLFVLGFQATIATCASLSSNT